MNNDIIIDALSSLDADLIEKHALYEEKSEKRSVKRKKTVKWGSLAACLALVIGLGALFIPMLTEDNGGTADNSNDILYAAEFGNYMYAPYHRGSSFDSLSAELPELEELYINGITEEHLGEYLGAFPALPSHSDIEGKAYRFALYPEYDSLIIVDYGGVYYFFVAGGLSFSVLENTHDSTTLLSLYGLPDTFKSFYIAKIGKGGTISDDTGSLGDPITSRDTFDALYAILSGKNDTEWAEIKQVEWEAWCAEYGDGRVKFDKENGFSYSDQTAHGDFSDFVNKNAYYLRLTTKNGFNSIDLTVSIEYRYFYMNNLFFTLTEAETAQIIELLGLE